MSHDSTFKCVLLCFAAAQKLVCLSVMALVGAFVSGRHLVGPDGSASSRLIGEPCRHQTLVISSAIGQKR